jgi:hypothetical protein
MFKLYSFFNRFRGSFALTIKVKDRVIKVLCKTNAVKPIALTFYVYIVSNVFYY